MCVAASAVSMILVGFGCGPALAQPAAEPPVVTTTPPFTTPDTDSCAAVAAAAPASARLASRIAPAVATCVTTGSISPTGLATGDSPVRSVAARPSEETP